MNAEKILTILFTLIDAMWDMTLVEWLDFKDANLEYFISDLSVEEKLELISKLHSLHLRLGTKEWSRRHHLCIKIHELI